jgi:5'-nucleotidase
MRLLLTNDDGVHAPGLAALARALQADHEVWVVAPSSERSAQSHALTMHKPLRLHTHGPRRFGVTGTPADCVYLGLHHLMAEHRPDLVLSGVNFGSNLGSDVHYSGTVAGAREACLQGVPAVAISLERTEGPMHWETATQVAAAVVRRFSVHGIPPRVLLNVNVPNRPFAELRGLRTCRLGERFYEAQVEARVDPRGHAYFWLGGAHSHFGDDPNSDGPLLSSGFATATPLAADATATSALPRFSTWDGPVEAGAGAG